MNQGLPIVTMLHSITTWSWRIFKLNGQNYFKLFNCISFQCYYEKEHTTFLASNCEGSSMLKSSVQLSNSITSEPSHQPQPLKLTFLKVLIDRTGYIYPFHIPTACRGNGSKISVSIYFNLLHCFINSEIQKVVLLPERLFYFSCNLQG